ncbi:MAG TPA: sigma-70 family RNA polymerase sigma factor [Beijerinckiaceae bacterium]|jgi:RNA polymerase sigma-70 factor (ECF subfamily)|nr:sigma-70 family RNA polymerase sigma factor [Beijerinckiaceae bacterium]
MTTRVAIDCDDLIRACALGDRSALRALYELEASRMIGVAQRLLRRRALAEEAVQDTFVSIWHKASTFDAARGAGRTWVYAILRHRALNMLRGERRLEFSDAPMGEEQASEDDDPETIVTQLSDKAALRRCLQGLAADRRAAIVLAYVHGLSHSDLAAKLGMPLGTVKSWLRRSLISLRECMG